MIKFTCQACPAQYWKLSDLFQHVEEQHKAVGITGARRYQNRILRYT